MINVVIRVENWRGRLMELCSQFNIKCNWVFDYWNEQYVYFYRWAFVQSSPYWVPRPRHFDWASATVDEFCDYYIKKKPCLVTTDNTYMPSSIWPDYQWKVQTTVTRDPNDPRKITSLHTKFLPIMNAYNTLVLKKDSSNHTTTTKKVKVLELVVLAFEVRIGRSADNVRAEMLRLIPEEYNVDDLDIMIKEIF